MSVGIVTVIVIQRNVGQRRQTTTYNWKHTSRSHFSNRRFAPAKPIAPPLPPEPVKEDFMSLNGDGNFEPSKFLAPLPVLPSSGRAIRSDLTIRLSQEVQLLRSRGYHTVTIGRHIEKEEHCILIRWPPDVHEQASIHVICQANFPTEPPQLIVTINELNEYSEIAEYCLNINSPVIEEWDHTKSIFQIIDSVVDILPGSRIDRSYPFTTKITDYYSKFPGE